MSDGLFVKSHDVLGWAASISFKTIHDDGGLLLFGRAVLVSQVLQKFCPSQLGKDEVGDFTDSVVKLPTLVTLKLA